MLPPIASDFSVSHYISYFAQMVERVNHNCETLMKNFRTSEDAEIDVKK